VWGDREGIRSGVGLREEEERDKLQQ